MSTYLDPATNFDGLEVMPKPTKYGNDWVICGRCQGHGSWNIKLNAYGPGIHFRQACGSCWGWGWIERGQCLHEWKDIRTVGNCLHLWKCTKCGHERTVDTSD